MHPPRILVLVTILGALAAGCTPAQTPSPSPTPTVLMCDPEFGGESFPCTQSDYELSERTKARYAEAERVYREYIEVSNREAVEGRSEPSEAQLALLGGQYREQLPVVWRQSQESADFEGQMRILWMKATQPTGTHASLTMLACTDLADWTVREADGSPGTTGLVAEMVEFDDASGSAKIIGIDGAEDASCA